jgi:hypothetical protein
MENEGKKNDFQDGKLRWDLLPLEEIEDIVKVYTSGANKYGENTWQLLDNGYERYKAALLRHLTAIEGGEIIDKESGLPHTAHVMWNSIALNHYLKTNRKVIYKDIPGYEDFYYADNLGNIYSKDRVHNTRTGGYYKKGRKLKPGKNNKGYLNVVLCDGKTQRTFRVHQLIAKTFLDNPNNYSEVNHKDENKLNNNVLNLEWCDRIHNMNYGTIRKRLSEHADAKNRVKAIIRTDSSGNEKYYKSITSVKDDDFDPSFVAKACKGIKKEAYGYKWSYALLR